jgi:hypothetical protein
MIGACRRLIIRLDGWSKKSLSASFLGISACFYHPVSHAVRHVILQLDQVQHPHTGEILSEALYKCLLEWQIPAHKVILIISDSGSNMIRAVKLLPEKHIKLTENVSGDEGTFGKNSNIQSSDGSPSSHDVMCMRK